MPNGNLLVVDQRGGRILELDRGTKKVVWEKREIQNPMDVDVLDSNGEPLSAPAPVESEAGETQEPVEETPTEVQDAGEAPPRE